MGKLDQMSVLSTGLRWIEAVVATEVGAQVGAQVGVQIGTEVVRLDFLPETVNINRISCHLHGLYSHTMQIYTY